MCSSSFFVTGTECFLVTNNISSLQMLVVVKCSGMHFTRSLLVVLILKMVSTWSEACTTIYDANERNIFDMLCPCACRSLMLYIDREKEKIARDI